MTYFTVPMPTTRPATVAFPGLVRSCCKAAGGTLPLRAEQTALTLKLYHEKPLSPGELAQLLARLLRSLPLNGLPAQISLRDCPSKGLSTVYIKLEEVGA